MSTILVWTHNLSLVYWVLSALLLPTLYMLFRCDEETERFEHSPYYLLPSAAVLVWVSLSIKRELKSKLNKEEYTGNGLRTLSEQEYRTNGYRTTKRELQKLKESAAYKEAVARKGYGHEQWNW